MELKTAEEFKSTEELFEYWKSFRAEVKEVLKRIPADKFTISPPGRWSISEVAEHLYLTQYNISRTIPIVYAGKFGFETDEQKFLHYEKIRDYFFRPSGVKNPDAVAPLNKYSLEQILLLLDEAELKMEKSLKNKEKSALQKRGFTHPYFGILNLFNFLWVMSLHEHSHLVALKERSES